MKGTAVIRWTLLGWAAAQRSPGESNAIVSCEGDFQPISANNFISAMNPGWNLGNTMDAVPNEGSWNNPPVIASTFDDVKAAGFKSVRIPVTYADHFTGKSPDWTIDPAWLKRVSEVVDMALDRDLYVITNIHHDSWEWADVTAPEANVTMIEEKIYSAWLQIGETLGCRSSRLAFEPINEPPTNSAEDGSKINRMNELFLKALADSGGFNTQRVVTLVGGSMDSIKTSNWFKAPAGYSNPWAIQYHYYGPYDFIFQAWGKTIWGSDADKESLEADFANIRGNFTDVPLVIGEFEANTLLEPAARRKYNDFVARTARKYNTSIILWDNGDGALDRATHTWRDPYVIDIINNAVQGVSNSLSDSTTDGSAKEQSSSAYIFHKAGEDVTDQTVKFILNGNNIKSIQTSDGKVLTASRDYSMVNDAVTIRKAFLSEYLSPTADPGSKANITVSFSAGAEATVEIVQWDLPILGSTTSQAVSGSDIRIPITWRGLYKLAAVKMLRDDGVYLFDDWTQYLGPLQQARGTYNSHWDRDGSHVMLKEAVISQVITSKVSTTFTFELYPRVEGNTVNYTLTI
ncbi:Endoglucanase B [Daldinia childiae]|uniref:Endoglucanase B n=1 Tax=Daldinia childiae TaxID=326645 RepID=UPI0014473CFB|nr:Endoglucanase B [Daldinia childiae]KAF3057393.1 Endoglucanase B [Daldinia childiae]